MAVQITKLNNQWTKVLLNPSIDGSKEILINHNVNVSRVRLVDDPETLDLVKIYLTEGETIELHYSAQVKINGVLASDNQDLINKIEQLFTS